MSTLYIIHGLMQHSTELYDGMFYICISNMVAIRYMWLLNTQNVASATEEQNFLFLN